MPWRPLDSSHVFSLIEDFVAYARDPGDDLRLDRACRGGGPGVLGTGTRTYLLQVVQFPPDRPHEVPVVRPEIVQGRCVPVGPGLEDVQFGQDP